MCGTNVKPNDPDIKAHALTFKFVYSLSYRKITGVYFSRWKVIKRVAHVSTCHRDKKSDLNNVIYIHLFAFVRKMNNAGISEPLNAHIDRRNHNRHKEQSQ